MSLNIEDFHKEHPDSWKKLSLFFFFYFLSFFFFDKEEPYQQNLSQWSKVFCSRLLGWILSSTGLAAEFCL